MAEEGLGGPVGRRNGPRFWQGRAPEGSMQGSKVSSPCETSKCETEPGNQPHLRQLLSRKIYKASDQEGNGKLRFITN